MCTPIKGCAKNTTMATVTSSTSESTTFFYPMDQYDPLTKLMTDLKNRMTNGVIRLRFCDAYDALRKFVHARDLKNSLEVYDTFADDPESTPTLSLVCALHSFSIHQPQQAEYMTRLWVATMEHVIRTEEHDEKSYQSFLDTFLRMFSSSPDEDMLDGKVQYSIDSTIQSMIQHQQSYEDIQRIMSTYCFDLGFGFHDGYMNATTLGLYCFLQITNGHPKQHHLVRDYLLQFIRMNLSPNRYYDEPQMIHEEYEFTIE